MSAGLGGGFGMKLEKKLARTGGVRQRTLGRVGAAAEPTLRAAAEAEKSSIARGIEVWGCN